MENTAKSFLIMLENMQQMHLKLLLKSINKTTKTTGD